MNKNDEITCTAGLVPGIIDEETFNREIALCRKLSKENNGGCCWGKCADCGVVPLLYKLHKGKIIDDLDEVQRIKNSIIS